MNAYDHVRKESAELINQSRQLQERSQSLRAEYRAMSESLRVSGLVNEAAHSEAAHSEAAHSEAAHSEAAHADCGSPDSLPFAARSEA